MSITPSASLRSLSGLGDEPARLAEAALVLIDVQNTYRSGVMALEGAEEAVAEAARLLARARAAGTPVVHIQHDSGEGSPYDLTAPVGATCDEVAPAEGEPVVVKNFPNAFHATDLEKVLTGLGFAAGEGKELVLAGFMTHMCVNYTAQAAFNLGYRPTVVAEATATRALAAPDGTVVPAAELKRAALTGLTDVFAVVVPTAADLRA
ncbi:isochorismatase family protein [Streptomyces sp. R302]|uniref:isochorismatase family protein n=1 Tax=unclassified Streptomyces TaxID=2593676 RepID=UPI00145F19A1|nr:MULTISPECIES: isochorismatase family protein [unclassified Streptomyces]NML54209.1 isochorismatase family protein [Streptomyces sp. R301]NML83469.1 isochorismatase family protein [Streptomyces sp. R302]